MLPLSLNITSAVMTGEEVLAIERMNIMSLVHASRSLALASRTSLAIAVLALLGLGTSAARAQNENPISLSGYNQDVIADGANGNPNGNPPTSNTEASTTTTLDGFFNFYTPGFNSGNPTRGLASGNFTSAANSAVTFTVQPAAGNNALLLSAGTSGTLTVTGSSAYSKLAFLVVGFNGSQPGSYTLNFAGGASATGTFTAPDNFENPGFAIAGFGRVRAGNDSFDEAVPATDPRLYEVDVALTSADAALPLSSITFNNLNSITNPNDPNIAVFGVSGLAAAPEPSQAAALGLGVLGLSALLLVARRRKANA